MTTSDAVSAAEDRFFGALLGGDGEALRALLTPDFVLVEGEWIGFTGKEGTTLTGLKRGQRRTKAKAHELNAPVRFGETFTTDVAIPAYREPQRCGQ